MDNGARSVQQSRRRKESSLSSELARGARLDPPAPVQEPLEQLHLHSWRDPSRECTVTIVARSTHRWFVMKQGKIFWFKSDVVTPDSVPRGVIDVSHEHLFR
jgi:hypothetical protein